MNAVITGASRGIGKAVAEIFALHGYNLYLCSRTEATLLNTIEELKGKYPNVNIDGQALNIGEKDKATMFGEWVLNNIDSVDVLVNNAGSFIQGNVSDEPEGVLEEMLSVNLLSAYYTTRTFLPRMRAMKSGHIFTLCSIASLRAYPGGGSYSISKYALLGFTRNLREELKNEGIKVTAVIPGAAYTDSWAASGLEEVRFMKADDIAKMIYAATQLSPQSVVEDIILRPQLGDI